MERFIELLKFQFDKHGDRPAIVYNDEILTYAQVLARSINVGAALQEKGLNKGDRVILYAPEKLSFLISHLGVILGGGVSVPLNFNFTEEELAFFLKDTGARFIFASGDQLVRLRRIKPKCPPLKEIIHPTAAVTSGKAKSFKEANLQADDICFMLYSSGTTGRPKGVVHTHFNLAQSLLSLQKCWRITTDDIVLNVLPLYHIHGLSFAAHLSLISGSCMMLEDKFHPLKTLKKIGQATVFMAVPTIYYALLRRPEFREQAKGWTKTRLFTCGSAPIRPEVLPELESILRKPLINRYGMTESHVITSLPLEGPFPPGSVGLPLDGIELKLVTSDGRTISAADIGIPNGKVVGSVKIRSKNLFQEYWNNPGSTTKEFDPNGFFATGDLGYFDKFGFLTLVGREKDLIITDGYNVYPSIVERVINSFAQVRESAVVGVPDKRRGEMVVGVIVADGPLDITELKKYCRSKLAGYQVPRRMELVDELPRNTMGKILKQTIRKNLID